MLNLKKASLITVVSVTLGSTVFATTANAIPPRIEVRQEVAEEVRENRRDVIDNRTDLRRDVIDNRADLRKDVINNRKDIYRDRLDAREDIRDEIEDLLD